MFDETSLTSSTAPDQLTFHSRSLRQPGTYSIPMQVCLHQSEKDQSTTPMESCGAIPHYLDVEVGVSTTLVLSGAPILARKDIGNPDLDLSRKSIVAVSHRICNASCDTGDSLKYQVSACIFLNGR